MLKEVERENVVRELYSKFLKKGNKPLMRRNQIREEPIKTNKDFKLHEEVRLGISRSWL